MGGTQSREPEKKWCQFMLDERPNLLYKISNSEDLPKHPHHNYVWENDQVNFYCEDGYQKVDQSLHQFICGQEEWNYGWTLDSDLLPRCFVERGEHELDETTLSLYSGLTLLVIIVATVSLMVVVLCVLCTYQKISYKRQRRTKHGDKIPLMNSIELPPRDPVAVPAYITNWRSKDPALYANIDQPSSSKKSCVVDIHRDDRKNAEDDELLYVEAHPRRSRRVEEEEEEETEEEETEEEQDEEENEEESYEKLSNYKKIDPAGSQRGKEDRSGWPVFFPPPPRSHTEDEIANCPDDYPENPQDLPPPQEDNRDRTYEPDYIPLYPPMLSPIMEEEDEAD